MALNLKRMPLVLRGLGAGNGLRLPDTAIPLRCIAAGELAHSGGAARRQNKLMECPTHNEEGKKSPFLTMRQTAHLGVNLYFLNM